MRNLHVANRNNVKFSCDHQPLTATAFDLATDDVICAFGPSPAKPIIELRRCKSLLQLGDPETTLITSWDAPCPLPNLDCDYILSLQYFHESAEIALVLAGGDLVLVREKPGPEQEKIEIVGSIDIGIHAAQWSWNASLLAIVTRAGSFVLMTRQLEPINEISLQESDLSLSKHISVGWGKKETQFQGKRAKALKDPTMPEFVDEGKPSPRDDGATTISWRGDGAYVAINSSLASYRRVIRVFSAEGVLDSVSEPVDGLEAALSWRPHGNIIASVKRGFAGSPRLEVVFFERNGLRHGEFDLRLSEGEMETFGSRLSLAWNQDSSILAVSMVDRIQLWTLSNYHYALKQEYRLENPSFIWHEDDPLKFCTRSPYLSQSIILEHTIDRGSICPPFDYGLIAVIDGKDLKLTPLKHANIPPPMAFVQMQAEENIISCAISRTCQRVAFITYKHLYLCTWEMQPTGNKSNSAVRHSMQLRIRKKDLAMFPHPSQVAIQNDDAVLLLDPAASQKDPQARCYKYAWVNTTIDDPALMTRDVDIPLDTRALIVDSRQESVWLRSSKDVICSEPGKDTIFTAISTTAIAKVQSADLNEIYVVSMDKDQQLLVDSKVYAYHVTSFAVTNEHIVYTTSNHFIKFIHLRQDSSKLQVPSDTPEVDERCRAIERGSLIVTVIPSTYAVILQMPRGNLETVYPRILVLAGIRTHIEDLNYKEAFLACRTHQVDLNILYDYNPSLWSANTKKFINQLKKPSRIDEFIQKLKEENVTKTLYRDTSVQEAAVPVATSAISRTNKINSICSTLIEALGRRTAEYQQNIITAHICKKPPDTTAALQLVSSLRQTSQEEADLAVSHLCFLSDTSRLYDAALGLYDLELTLLVAQNAQRDPREYMPFLQSLQTLPELRRRYTIDNHLKRYVPALTHLHTLQAHDELELYAVKHNLYIAAESLYADSPTQRWRITRLHADHLAATSQPRQAAILYESLHDFNTAYPLYALAHDWQESLTCGSLVPLSQNQLVSLATSLATSIIETNRDYRAAATIHMDYLNDPLTAATLLCKSSYFADAIRLLSLHNHQGEILTIIDTSLTRKFGEIIELIADCTSQLNSQVPRIEELRTKKELDPLAFYGGDTVQNGIDFPDNVSLAPTDASTLGGQSMFTRYGGGAGGSQASTKFAGTVRSDMSRQTSKTRRREERKRARGKKGSIYEEEYLIASVERLVQRVNGTHEEVRRLVMGLKRRGMRDLSEKIEGVMRDIEERCAGATQRIWEVDGVGQDSNRIAVSENVSSGANGIVNDGFTDGLEGIKLPPKVKAWESVS